ncbi:MAG: hypothetical protein PHV08_07320 [Sulfurovaceae bacterium]|nr:hypothetical protein [Sulfurovaceae bacterium]
MSIEKNETISEIQTAQKENWEKPELSELDINKTESGLDLGLEALVLSPYGS